jgi:hypothetical protein
MRRGSFPWLKIAATNQGKESAVVKYRVTLTEQERDALKKIGSAGKGTARSILHARILLLTDQGEHGQYRSDGEIIDALDVGRSTIYRVRERFVEDGLEAALVPRKMPRRPDKIRIRGETEKKLIALACSDPPEGRAVAGRWSCWRIGSSNWALWRVSPKRQFDAR